MVNRTTYFSVVDESEGCFSGICSLYEQQFVFLYAVYDPLKYKLSWVYHHWCFIKSG